MIPFSRTACLVLFGAVAGVATAWDYSVHRCINLLALDGLPEDFPSVVNSREARERIAFLAGEPDRWRNVSDLSLRHYNALDHYFDVEYLADAGLDPRELSPLRYEFAVAFARGRARFPEHFPSIDEESNHDHTREWPGFLPWSVVEYYGKLKSAFSYVRTFEQFGGSSAEIRNAHENVIQLMGLMGHYVGDAAQPLHTTKHFNGWTGESPEGYTTWNGFHQWIDGGYLFKAGVGYRSLRSRARPAAVLFVQRSGDDGTGAFRSVLSFILEQHAQVEPLYRLDRERKLQGGNEPVDPEGAAFIRGQLLRGAAMLSSLWLTAWENAEIDDYLRERLESRMERNTERTN